MPNILSFHEQLTVYYTLPYASIFFVLTFDQFSQIIRTKVMENHPTFNTEMNNVPNITPNPTPNITSDPTLNTPTPTELKSPKKEDNDEQLINKKKPTRTSSIWDHFTKIVGGDLNDPRCTCNYCAADYACHSRRVGTSSLWTHMDKCKKNPHRMADKKQKLLSFQSGNDGAGNLLAVTFNKVRCRNALAKYVVKDEQAFNVVEGEGFKELLQELQPRFSVPSRNTIIRDIHHLFCNERVKLMKELTNDGQRICLTTDCWTSSTQMSYMCITEGLKDLHDLHSFRSSLSPKMVEALICTQSWLKEGHGGIKLKEYLDEVQAYEFLEEEKENKAKGATTSEKVIDV